MAIDLVSELAPELIGVAFCACRHDRHGADNPLVLDCLDRCREGNCSRGVSPTELHRWNPSRLLVSPIGLACTYLSTLEKPLWNALAIGRTTV